STTCNRSVTLPAAIQPGRYAIGAIADDESQLPDPDRANNTRTSDSGAITITNVSVRPAFPAQGVANAASYQGGGVAPGEMVTLFGSNLGPAAMSFPAVRAGGV